MRTITNAIYFGFMLGCFISAPAVLAVNPPPAGGYPGGNTAAGQSSLFNLTSGIFNTAIGFLSLRSNTEGQFNTGVGAGTLLANTAGQNTAIGAGALLSNTIGDQNTASGAFALLSNTEGTSNTANGAGALQNNTTGFRNTANGSLALFSNTDGEQNTASGYRALFSNTIGQLNTASGFEALLSNTFGEGNTAFGHAALSNNTTGNNNKALGIGAGSGVTTATNVIAIGNSGANVNNSCFIGNIRGIATANANAIPVLIDSAGQLGTISSSRRFKHNIKPMDRTSNSILGLKPVTFHYKNDKTNTPQFGLIAEEVAAVNPDLVVRDENGEIYTVRYDAVNAMLLNEFLKEHQKVQELQANDAEQQREIKALAAIVKEQAAQIQKVSAHPGAPPNPLSAVQHVSEMVRSHY